MSTHLVVLVGATLFARKSLGSFVSNLIDIKFGMHINIVLK